MAYDEQTAERVRAVLAGRRNVVEKKMIGGLSFMVNGNMCCSVSGGGGLLVRIEPAMRERVLAMAHVCAVQMGARTMTGFVRVEPAGYRTDLQIQRWVERGIDAAAALPQKSVSRWRKKR